MNTQWNYRPEVFRTVWRKQKDLGETYESYIDGVGAPLAFADSMFRWLEELDHHGMHALLKVEGSTVHHLPHIQQEVSDAALMGSTDLDVLDIPCAQITAQMNSACVDPKGATKFFVSSLMECCVLRAQ